MECSKCHKEWERKIQSQYDVFTKDGHRYIHEICPRCGHVNELELVEITDPEMIQALIESQHATFH